jgi:epoxyqueuosine reductase
MTKLSEVWPLIERIAGANGVLRVSASELVDGHTSLFDEWLAAGRHAGMRYLERHASVRRDPRARFPWARSVIVIIVPYSPSRAAAPAGALSNHVARYALGDDYHDVLDRILRNFETELAREVPEVRTWRYVDTGPLSDRALAAQAGLGWIGKNGMLIDEEYGSYTFVGTLLTSLENDTAHVSAADRCGTCTRCIDACPTAAILPDRTLDSHRCISYATIEHRGPLDPFVAQHLESNAFGCDICQEVCPWNREAPPGHPAFATRDEYRNTPVTDLLRFSQADFSTLFRQSAVKRAKLEGMKRNVEALLREGQEPTLAS